MVTVQDSTRMLRVSQPGYIPVPVRLTVCGLPPPLSVIESWATRLPLARGVNVTLIEHDAPAPKLVPHVVVSE
jgi:hypothetical protein